MCDLKGQVRPSLPWLSTTHQGCLLAGVDIEIFESSKEVGPRIEAAEDLNPQQLFGLYSTNRSMSPEAVAAGARILEGVAVGSAAGLQRSAVVHFGSVELEGYLSFRCALLTAFISH